MPASPAFDPDGPAAANGLFGLPAPEGPPALAVLPVPFDATCSYGRGTAEAPAAVLRASREVDLDDPDFGEIWRPGLVLDAEPAELRAWNREAQAAAARWRAERDEAARAVVDERSQRRTQAVAGWTAARLAEGTLPALLGGDHSCALGGLLAAAARGPLSILQLDAHMDLREAYEGFRESHASVMHEALARAPGIERLVQVGVRDAGRGERARARRDERILAFELSAWREAELRGTPFHELAARAVGALGQRVWISFDIDVLEPWLCPRTGTPVPGGLDFGRAVHVLRLVAGSGRRIAGFDLCEIGAPPTADPRHPADEWDAVVGARLLYKLCGAALSSQGRLDPEPASG